MKIFFLNLTILLFSAFVARAQSPYKSYHISVRGDTINVTDTAGLKQGPWVLHVDPLRGEPGYEEEGYFVDGKKEGNWRKYSLVGDFIALENYRGGDKDGKSQYFNKIGDLIREENWHAYNPEEPYDTIAIYGEHDEILSYKIVRAQPYSVKDGDWIWYDSQTGRISKIETYDRGHLLKNKSSADIAIEKPMEKIKPKEVVEYEKENSKKKKVKVREGRTSY